jgi:hypothetical protein
MELVSRASRHLYKAARFARHRRKATSPVASLINLTFLLHVVRKSRIQDGAEPH